MAQKKPQKKWIRPHHYFVWTCLFPFVALYTRLRYRITVKPFPQQGKRPYLVLMNHQTPFDQFFVCMAVKGPVYFLATEDIFSLGWVSHIIRFLVSPIPIKKQTGDLKATMTCLRVAKEGGTIALSPEGNRTYSGRTEYINPAIAKLARHLKLPIAIFRIEGGYGTQPRWSDVIRKGRMQAGVSRVIEPEEYRSLSDEEFYDLLCRELYVDEAVSGGPFLHPKQAEYLERAIYVCPFCGLSTFESHGDTVTCHTCGRQVRHLPDKTLEGVNFDFPFTTVGDWYDYQSGFVNRLDTGDYTETPLFTDTASLSEVIVYKHKVKLRDAAAIRLYGDRITIDEGTEQALILPFHEITALAVLGRNKANIYHGERVFQLKGSKRFNALKYVQIYYRNKNISRGDVNAKFLGL